MLKRFVNIQCVLVCVFVLQAGFLYAAEFCEQAKIDKLAAAGLTKEQIFKVCPQIECSAERVANLKEAGLDDCEIDQLCPGHFKSKVTELKDLGLSEAEIGSLFPQCFVVEEMGVSVPEKVSESPDVDPSTTNDGASDDSDPRASLSQSSCRDCGSGSGRLDVVVSSGKDNAVAGTINTLTSVIAGAWYDVKVFIDDEKIGEGKAIGGQKVELSKAVPVGKHEIKIQAKYHSLLIIPSRMREYKRTLHVTDGTALKLKVFVSKMYAREKGEKEEDLGEMR